MEDGAGVDTGIVVVGDDDVESFALFFVSFVFFVFVVGSLVGALEGISEGSVLGFELGC